MTAPPPPCPGGTKWRTVNLAKRHAWWAEPERAKRPVAVQCGDHWHLTVPDPK